MNRIIKVFLALILTMTPVLADIDWSEFGSFSDRSTIMSGLNQAGRITPEQKELLKQRKLVPTTQCLIQQIKKNKLDNVQLLLDAKVKPNESYYMEYPIYTAAKANNFEALQMLYDNGAKLDRGFFSELFEAVKNKNQLMTDFLLEKGAKVNYIDSLTQNSILYYAIKNNMIETAKDLIEKGATVDRKTAILVKKKKLQYLFEK